VGYAFAVRHAAHFRLFVTKEFIMQFHSLSFACGALCLALAGQAAAQNLIQNGNFQDSSVAAGTYQYANGFGPFGGPLVVPGWSFRDGTGIVNYSPAWGGQASVDAVAFLQNYPLPNFENPSVAQSFASNAGNFAVSFDLAQRPSYSASSIDVYLDTQRIAQNLLPADSSWRHFTFNVTGVSGSGHTLSFYAFSEPNIDSATFLSHVAVTAVPEPESWALMLAGLAGLGWSARRKRAMVR
jgi:hypothetical protein